MRYVYIHKRARAHTPLLGASAHAFEHHTHFWMCELTRSALHMCALRVAWIHTHTHTHTHTHIATGGGGGGEESSCGRGGGGVGGGGGGGGKEGV